VKYSDPVGVGVGGAEGPSGPTPNQACGPPRPPPHWWRRRRARLTARTRPPASVERKPGAYRRSSTDACPRAGTGGSAGRGRIGGRPPRTSTTGTTWGGFTRCATMRWAPAFAVIAPRSSAECGESPPEAGRVELGEQLPLRSSPQVNSPGHGAPPPGLLEVAAHHARRSSRVSAAASSSRSRRRSAFHSGLLDPGGVAIPDPGLRRRDKTRIRAPITPVPSPRPPATGY
jgi:hypothetical protein